MSIEADDKLVKIAALDSFNNYIMSDIFIKNVIKRWPNIYEELDNIGAIRDYIRLCNNPELARQAELRLWKMTK